MVLSNEQQQERADVEAEAVQLLGIHAGDGTDQ